MNLSKRMILSAVGCAVLSLAPQHARAEALRLFPGWPTAMEGKSASSADPSIAEVAVTAKGLRITGKKEGHTRLTLVGTNGASQSVDVDVMGAGWRLVSVLVVKHAMDPGTLVTAADVEARSVPEFMVTSAQVKPDQFKWLSGFHTAVPIQEGDMLTWVQFPTREQEQENQKGLAQKK